MTNDTIEIIRGWRELTAKVHRSRAQLWRDIKNGRFPPALELGENSVGWITAEIDEWLVSRRRRTYGAAPVPDFDTDVVFQGGGPPSDQDCNSRFRGPDHSRQNRKIIGPESGTPERRQRRRKPHDPAEDNGSESLSRQCHE